MEKERDGLNLIQIKLLEVARLKTARKYVTNEGVARALNMHRDLKRAHAEPTPMEIKILNQTKIEPVEPIIIGEAA